MKPKQSLSTQGHSLKKRTRTALAYSHRGDERIIDFKIDWLDCEWTLYFTSTAFVPEGAECEFFIACLLGWLINKVDCQVKAKTLATVHDP